MIPPDRLVSAGSNPGSPLAGDPPALADAKRALRRRMRPMRLVAEQKEGPDAALAIARIAVARLDDLGLAPGRVLAGYWPISTEIDVRPLLARAEVRGIALALPAIVPGEDALVFRRWSPTEDLEPGEYETRQPFAGAPEVVPDALLVPLLGVDRAGRRLGHGRGWYDRTLARLRGGAGAVGGPVTIGVCFGSQVVDRVPAGAGDERVAWILSPAGLERVAAHAENAP